MFYLSTLKYSISQKLNTEKNAFLKYPDICEQGLKLKMNTDTFENKQHF